MTPLRRIERQLAVELLWLERKLDPALGDTPEREARVHLYVKAVESYCKVKALLSPSPPPGILDPPRAPGNGPRLR